MELACKTCLSLKNQQVKLPLYSFLNTAVNTRFLSHVLINFSRKY